MVSSVRIVSLNKFSQNGISLVRIGNLCQNGKFSQNGNVHLGLNNYKQLYP